MRSTTLVLTLSLVTAALALAPTASAEAPACPEAAAGSPWSAYHVTVDDDCTTNADVFPNPICVGGSSGTVRTGAGPASASVSYCRPYTGDPVATTSAMPGCRPGTTEAGPVSVTMEHACRAHVVLFEDIHCVGPWIGKAEAEVSGNTVTAYYCWIGGNWW